MCVFLFFAGVIVGVAIARGQAPDWNPARAPVPGLRCLDPDQQLGTIWQTDELVLEFHLVNNSPKQSFKVGPIRGTCLCTEVRPESLTILPGQSAAVKAVVDLDAFRPNRAPLSSFAETVIALVDEQSAEPSPLLMRARGVVRPSYRVEPDTLRFGRVIQQNGAESAAEVECLWGMPVSRMEVVEVPGWADASFEPLAEQAYRLKVRVKQGVEYGPLKGRVRFRALGTSEPFVTRSLSLTGFVEDDIIALPSSLLFGAVPLGQEQSAIITILSRKGEQFQVLRIEKTGSQVTTERESAVRPGQCRYRIGLRPDRLGVVQERATFHLGTRCGRERLVTVGVGGYALPE